VINSASIELTSLDEPSNDFIAAILTVRQLSLVIWCICHV